MKMTFRPKEHARKGYCSWSVRHAVSLCIDRFSPGPWLLGISNVEI